MRFFSYTIKIIGQILLLSIVFEIINITYFSHYNAKIFLQNKTERSTLFSLLRSRIIDHYSDEFFHGAHIIFFDDGRFFEELISHADERYRLLPRFSLHYNFFEPQFSFTMPKAHLEEVLFGKALSEGGQVISWIQAEKHSCRTYFQCYWHAIDALIYLATLQSFNIGPLGFSQYTSSAPLVIQSEPLP